MGSLRSAATATCITPAKPHQALLEDELNHLLPLLLWCLCLIFMAWAATSLFLLGQLVAMHPHGNVVFLAQQLHSQAEAVDHCSPCSRSHKHCDHHCSNSFKGKVTLGKD